MKKQYLIGLLGIAALSFSFGNGLFNSTNKALAPSTQSNNIDTDDNLNDTKIDITRQPYNLENHSASIDYKISLYYVNDFYAHSASKVNTVRWMDGATELASADYSEKEDSERTGIVTGTLTATNLLESYPYNDTVIVLNFFDDHATSQVNRKIEAEVDDFIIKPAFPKPTDVTNTLGEVTENSAEVSYVIDPGKDKDNNPYEIASVEWVDEGGNLFGNTEPETDGKTTGSFKATGLGAGETYNTELKVEFVDEKQNTSTDVKVITESHTPEKTSIEATLGVEDETTAEVSYVIDPGKDEHNKPYEISTVEWVGEDDKAFGNTKPHEGDITHGNFTATELTPGETYNTELKVEFVNEKQNTSTDVKVITESHTPEKTSIEATLGVEDETTAEVSYVIDPGKDEHNNPYEISTVEWVGEDDKAFGNTKPHEGDITHGNFTATELTPGETYNTELKVEFVDEKQNTSIDVKVITESHTPEKTSIEATLGVEDETTAEVSYVIDPGKDEHNNPYEISTVEWIGEDDKTFGNTKPHEGDITHGNFTATELTPGETYNTELKVEFVDEKQNTSTDVKVITESHTPEKTSIEATLGVEDETTAEVSYVIDPGKDEHNKPYEISTVEWVGEDDKAFGNTKPHEGDITHGNFTATGLTPGETYNTELKVEFVDEKQNTSIDVKVETVPHQIEQTSLETTVGIVTNDTATITYDINQGKDEHNNPYEITSVEWVDEDNNAFGNTEANDDVKSTGTFTATGLTPDQTYNTKINVTFVDTDQNITENNKVDPITTGVHPDQEEPTLNIINTTTTSDSVTFSYLATEGLDSHGNPYYLADIEIFDEEHNRMGSKGSDTATEADALELYGSITINELNADTTYQDWTAEATFINYIDTTHPHETGSIEIDQFQTLETEDTFKIGIIVSIIIIILLLTVIIGYGGYYLYKKYQA